MKVALRISGFSFYVLYLPGPISPFFSSLYCNHHGACFFKKVFPPEVKLTIQTPLSVSKHLPPLPPAQNKNPTPSRVLAAKNAGRTMKSTADFAVSDFGVGGSY